MLTVINALKLFLLISVGLSFFMGLGWLVIGPLLHGSLTIKKKDIPLLHEIPPALLSGVIINYGVILCIQSLKLGLIIGSIISIFGVCCFALYIFQNHSQQQLNSISLNVWVGMAFVCLLFLSPILGEPLKDWDARSIWFFHAKMIYSAGSFGESAGWLHPAVTFSQIDYPKLVPVLAAQVGYTMGFWNEYIPKTSLLFMLMPAVIWLFTFARRSFSFVILLLLIPFSFYLLLWNGYMDGYLALYFSIAMLLLGRYINTSQPIDMISSLCCLALLLYIKNEGALAVLIGLFLAVSVQIWKGKKYPVKSIFEAGWKYYLVALIALLPFVIWTLYKEYWNLSNGLGIGTTQSLLQISNRLTDGSYKLIFQYLYKSLEGALLLLGLLYFASIAWRKPLARESLPAFIAAGIYCLGMITIYLLTPFDLSWHLSSSINRTMLSVNGCIFIGCYYLLNSIENNEDTSL